LNVSRVDSLGNKLTNSLFDAILLK
jgi:hypothetical protein